MTVVPLHGDTTEDREHRPARAVLASIRRYDLTKTGDVEALAKMHEEWQQDAWFYSDVVGEMMNARRAIENSFRKLRVFAGFRRQPDAEAIPVGDAVRGDQSPGGTEPTDFLDSGLAAAAEGIVESFRARDGGQAALLSRAGVNIFMVGDLLLINRRKPLRRPGQGESVTNVEVDFDWEVRSVDEVRRSQQTATDLEIVGRPGGKPEPLDADAWVERVWRPHPRWTDWADSNVRAAVGVLEEMHLLNKLARVSTRARIFGGILKMPDELDWGSADQPAGEGSGASRGVKFDREIEDVMASVIGDESDPATVAPLPLRGPAKFLKEVDILEIPRRFGKEEREQYTQASVRLGRTIELPNDWLTGVSNVNHWTAWQIDEDTYKAYIEPLALVLTDALTYALLLPKLRELGWAESQIDRLAVSVDPSMLVRRADRGKVAGEGVANGAASFEAWRRANGMGDDDAPSDEERMLRWVLAGKPADSVAVAILKDQGLIPDNFQMPVPPPVQNQPGSPVPNPPGPDGTPVPGGADQGPPPSVGSSAAGGPPAAAAASLAGDATSARRSLGALARYDRALFDRLSVAADASLRRAVDKAGARLRSLANRNGAAQRILADHDVPNQAVAAALGPATVAALTPETGLIDWPWEADLRSSFDRQVQAVQDALLVYVPEDQLVDFAALHQDHREAAWAWLAAALTVEAEAALARGGGSEDPRPEAEFDTSLVLAPVVIREYLARAGGAQVERSRADGLVSQVTDEPVGGVGTGATARMVFSLAGIAWTGYRWDYGDVAARSQPFSPHMAMAGRVFPTWSTAELASVSEWPPESTYFPGDHRHCKCTFTPVVGDASTVPAD